MPVPPIPPAAPERCCCFGSSSRVPLLLWLQLPGAVIPMCGSWKQPTLPRLYFPSSRPSCLMSLAGSRMETGQGTICSSLRSSCSSLLMWRFGGWNNNSNEKSKRKGTKRSLPCLAAGRLIKHEKDKASKGNLTLSGNPLHHPSCFQTGGL